MKKITVIKENAGKRIDKFLSEEFFLYSRGEIIRKIKKGDVTIDNRVVKPSRTLSLGEIIALEDDKNTTPGLTPNELLEIKIIFENSDFIVIDKPAGLQAHPSATEKNSTVSNWLLAHYPEAIGVHDDSEEGIMRPGIVHRLDKDTSGVMIVTKNMHSFLEFKKLFAERKVTKTYVALVYGRVVNDNGTIDAPISRSADHKKQVTSRRKMATKVLAAITEYSVATRYTNFTLLKLHPLTGRMHQIRVHCLHMGYPIVGDKKYGKKGFDTKLAPARQLLHAESISFELFGKKYSFQAPLAEDFESFLANID